ncbi:MAG TPA: C39 family peptidase [Labilithrix sp.]|nr:C39 family peptidase [Labilithrix sp.]
MRIIRNRHVAVWSLVAFASVGLGCSADVEQDDSTEATQLAVQSAPRWKVLNISYEVQQTGYWCGPSATRVAISARRSPPSQSQLASELGTTVNGTDHIGQVTRVLNRYIGGYETREMPNDPPLPAQKSALWRDVVRNIDNNFVVVANIVAPPSNHPPGYPNQTIYHYFAVIGYNPDTWEVFIADSANFGGNKMYWIPFDQLATLIPPKGYSAWFPSGTVCDGGSGTVIGAIEEKYEQLGGCAGFLGAPLTDEMTAPDRAGRYSVFEGGSIYWTQSTGAHEVHGAIRDAWKEVGWEAGTLGYPITDELVTPDTIGRFNHFQKGSIYFSPATGAHEVYGAIRDKWKSLGWEQSALGYPVTGEYGVNGGRRSDFEHGSITWRSATNETVVELY